MTFKKNLVKLTSSIVIVLLILALGIMIYINQKTDYVSWEADYPIYYSPDDLEKNSDLIIIGSPQSIKNHVRKDERGIVEEGYTVTGFKIDSIVSENSNYEIPEQISVIEPYFDYEPSLRQKLVLSAGKQIITTENYQPMKENSKYLLFLYFVEDENVYVINGLYQGKYRIDNSNLEVYYGECKEQDYKYNSQLNELVKNKYKKEISVSLK